MFCDKCGAKNRDGATFCSNCGERLYVEGPVSSSQTNNGSLSEENPSEPINKKQYVKRDQSPIESIKKVIAECIPSIKSINAVEKKSLHTGTFCFLVCAILLTLQIIVSGVVVFINSHFVSQQMDYFDLCLARTYSSRLWIYALDMFYILCAMIMAFLLYRSKALHIPRAAVIIPAVLCSMQIIIVLFI